MPRAKRLTAEDIEASAYLTDGQHLYRVLRTFLPNGQVMLEDSGAPGDPAVVVSVTELVAQGMSVVRPSA